jgi:hypothetical protein
MDSNYSKLFLIDDNYLIYNSYLDVTEDTKINADNSECATKWQEWKLTNKPSSNFVTEIFFTTLFYAHYGFMRYIDFNSKAQGDIIQVSKRILRSYVNILFH